MKSNSSLYTYETYNNSYESYFFSSSQENVNEYTNIFHAEGSSSNSSTSPDLTRQFTQTYDLNISNLSKSYSTNFGTTSNFYNAGNETRVTSLQRSIIVDRSNVTLSNSGATSKATKTQLTTTNTGIGATTLNTNTTYGSFNETVDEFQSTYVFKTIISQTFSPFNYQGHTTYETLGSETSVSSVSSSYDMTRPVIELIYQTSQDTFETEIDSFISSTFQDLFSFFETTSVILSRYFEQITSTSLIVNYSTSVGSYVSPSNFSSSFQTFFQTAEGTSSYSILDKKGYASAYTMDTFVENFFNPLEKFYVLTRGFEYVFSTPLKKYKFDEVFKSSYGEYIWEDQVTFIDLGDENLVRFFGESINGSTFTYTVLNGWTGVGESVYLKTSSLDTPFFIQEIKTYISSVKDSTALKIVAKNRQEQSSTISSIVESSTLVAIPTVIKTDPLNFKKTTINIVDRISTIGSAVKFLSTTIVETSPVSSSSSSQNSETFIVSNSFATTDSFRSALSSGSLNEIFSFSLSKSFNHSSSNKISSDIIFNKADTFNDNLHYAICPEFKAGYIGFEGLNDYENFSIERFGEDFEVTINTKVLKTRNYKKSFLTFDCNKIIHAERVSATKTFASSPIEISSYDTFTSGFTFYNTYIPNFSTSESIESDSLKMFYYTASLRNPDSSTFEVVSGGISLILLNSCSNLENFRIDRDIMGGFYPETSQAGTLYYRGYLKGTQVSPNSSFTVSFFNSNPQLSSYLIPYGNHISIIELPQAALGFGSHTFS